MNIAVSPRASEELKKAVDAVRQENQNATVRVMAQQSCGCGNTKFAMGFDDPEEGDLHLELGGVTLVVDPMTAPYLEGAEMDYSDDLMGKGFLINTPQAGGGCGCGGHGHAHGDGHQHHH